MVKRTYLVLARLLMAIAVLAWQAVAQANPPEKHRAPTANQKTAAQFVGADVCKSCHEELFNKFGNNPHHHLIAEGKGALPEAHGCESCHGPASAHVEGGGDVSKIVNFKTLSPKAQSEVCQKCHEGGERSNFHRSAHLDNGIGCTSCHAVHAAETKVALLKKESPTLCYQCHTEQKAEFGRPYRHRVNEGLVQCADCHNEHGGFLPKQLKTSAAQDQVCFKCHTEKKGPFVYEHLPVKTEGCTACHTPHGSTNPRLLRVAQVNQLCLQCHTLSLNNIPSQPAIGPAHNQAQKYQACTMCHEFVHGSNFSEVFFKP